MNGSPVAWRDVFFQCTGFLSSFLILGAVGFRYGVVRRSSEDVTAVLVSTPSPK